MKYVWCKKEGQLTNAYIPTLLFGRTTRFSFGDKAYINRNGFAQHRIDSTVPDGYVGRVLTTKRNISITDLIRLEFELLRRIMSDNL